MKPIYLDYNATTPIDPAVAEAMLPYLREHFGNPSSSHWYGRQAKRAVELAREQVTRLLGCHTDEVIFTGGGSEASNQAIKGVAEAFRSKGNHIITSQVEHPATLEPCRYLESHGYQVTYLPVDCYGRVAVDAVAEAITSRTILITIMHANNEVGTIQPVEAIGQLAHERGILFHTDAAQTVGKIPTDMGTLGVDMLSLAGHKLYAPKGVGVLYLRRGLELPSLIHGAGHESGRRAGTENVLEIVGLGKACELAAEETDLSARLTMLRNMLHAKLRERFELVLNGHPTGRLPNTLNVSLVGIGVHGLLDACPEVTLSTGSACHSDRVEISPVLTAMGVPPQIAQSALRFSVGKPTQPDEIERAVDLLATAAQSVHECI